MLPRPRPTIIPSGILIHPAVWPQQIWAENWGLCPFLEGRWVCIQDNVAWAEAYLCTKCYFDPSSHLAITVIDRKLGGCAPFLGGEMGPHLAQCGLGRGLPPYQVASWHIQLFGHNRNEPKIGGLCPLGEGELGTHLAQCGLDGSPPPCQVPSWSIQPFGHNRRGPKIGGSALFFGRGLDPHTTQCHLGRAYLPTKWHLDPSSHVATTDMGQKLGGLCPFGGGGAGSPSNAMWPGPRPTCMPSFILIHPTVWPQCTNVTDRTDKQWSDSIGRTVL